MTRQLVLAIVIVLLPIFHAWGQETALKQFQADARSNPKNAAAQTALGRALLRAGRWNEAERQLERAARLLGNSAEAQYEVVKVKFESGNYRSARAACRALSQKHPNTPIVHVCKARAFLVWKRSARAFEALDEALKLDPDSIEALLALGEAHRMRGSYDESQTAYQRALELLPNDARAYLGLGLLNETAGKKEKAIEALRRAYQIDPSSPKTQFELGRAVGGKEGLTLLQQAVQGRPKWAEAELALAELQLDAGNLDMAEKTAANALKHSPALAGAYTVLGRARFKMNKLEDSEKALRRALELVPNDPLAAIALANVFAKTERYEDAFEQYRVAADLAPKETEALVAAAQLGMRLSRNALATGFLDRALERDAKSAKTLSLYGDVLAARNDFEQAREYYNRALKGHGEVDRDRIRKRLQQLK